jgi:hypothetical protein
MNLTESPIYDLLTILPKLTGYKIEKEINSIIINTTISVKPEPSEEPKLSLEQMIKNAFEPQTSMSFIMLVSIFLFILSTIAFIICCCKGNIMQCLRKSGFRKPNPNKLTQLFARHQQEVKEQCKTIGKDVNKI